MTVVAVLASLGLSACQSQTATQPTTIPTPLSASAPINGKPYVLDAQASEIRLLVYRDGPMARLGHNHVMSGKVQGEISVGNNTAESSFHLQIPVTSFEVDLPEQRAEEGAEFSTLPSEPARKGTRNNMLGLNVLDAEHHPEIRIDSVALSGPRWNPDVTARITLRGKTSEVKFPAAIIEQGDTLTVVATFRLLQTSMGLEPYSILGGAVRVRDAIDVRIRLQAHPTR